MVVVVVVVVIKVVIEVVIVYSFYIDLICAVVFDMYLTYS